MSSETVDGSAFSGHSVLQVSVPELEAFVLARTRHYDRSFVSADPSFNHAHVTVLGPWLPRPTARDTTLVAAIAAATSPFDYRLDDVAAFPDGIVHASPSPVTDFQRLTDRLRRAFPQCPPYQGRFEAIHPHVTLDLLSETVSIASTRRLLGADLPASCHARRLDLAWYEAGACRVLDSWPLGPGA